MVEICVELAEAQTWASDWWQTGFPNTCTQSGFYLCLFYAVVQGAKRCSLLPERPHISLIWRGLGPKCCLSSSDWISARLLQLHCSENVFISLSLTYLWSSPVCPWFYQLRICLCVVYDGFLNECLLASWCCWHFGADGWEEKRRIWIQDSRKRSHLIFHALWLTLWFMCL